MSHDRGCPCGRERWEYEDCDERDCRRADIVARWREEGSKVSKEGRLIDRPRGMEHLDYLRRVADEDVEHVLQKEKTYGGSWKKRGGVGAFMMLARKWDRLENMLRAAPRQWDVLHCAAEQTREANQNSPVVGLQVPDGTVLAEVRDLRRYLLLVEAEILSQLGELADDGGRFGDGIMSDEELTAPLRHGAGGMENPRGYNSDEEEGR